MIHACMCAGDGVVQFVRPEASDREFAVRFFVASRAFKAERRMYRDAPLQTFLPDVEVHGHDTWHDADGHAFPPCIVMERGESLAEWAHATQPDRMNAITVRTPQLSTGPSHVCLPPLRCRFVAETEFLK